MSPYKEKSLKFEYPFVIYPYKEKRQKKVALDFIVFNQETESFKASFNKNGTQILLYTKLPELFTSKRRVMAANTKLEEDTSKTVAFEEAIGEEDLIKKKDPIYGPPQIITLPYPCDTSIPIEHSMDGFEAWEVPNDDINLHGEMQYHWILSIEVESTEKAVRRVAKKQMNIIRSPRSKTI